MVTLEMVCGLSLQVFGVECGVTVTFEVLGLCREEGVCLVVVDGERKLITVSLSIMRCLGDTTGLSCPIRIRVLVACGVAGVLSSSLDAKSSRSPGWSDM